MAKVQPTYFGQGKAIRRQAQSYSHILWPRYSPPNTGQGKALIERLSCVCVLSESRQEFRGFDRVDTGSANVNGKHWRETMLQVKSFARKQKKKKCHI
jgi:hypothetical protein